MLRATFQGTPQRLEITRGANAYDLIAEPILDPVSGEVSSVLLFCFNVTERKRAHDAIVHERAVLTQFRAFIEHIPLGIVIVRNDEIAYVNPAMLKILGYTDASQLVGRPLLETFIHPDERSAVTDRIATATIKEVVPRRTRYLRRDGTTVPVEVRGQPFEFEGTPSVIAASRDITDEVAAEQARREVVATLETFRLMVEAIKDYAIFQLDREGRVKTWNSGRARDQGV